MILVPIGLILLTYHLKQHSYLIPLVSLKQFYLFELVSNSTQYDLTPSPWIYYLLIWITCISILVFLIQSYLYLKAKKNLTID